MNVSTVNLQKAQEAFKFFRQQVDSLVGHKQTNLTEISGCFLAILSRNIQMSVPFVSHYINEYVLLLAALCDTVETLEYGTCKSAYQHNLNRQFTLKDKFGHWFHKTTDTTTLTAASVNGLNQLLGVLVSCARHLVLIEFSN